MRESQQLGRQSDEDDRSDQHPYGVDDTATLMGLVAVLKRRFRLILAVTVIGTGLSAFALSQLTPQYTSASGVMVAATDTDLVALNASVDPTVLETQIQFLQSRSHARRVVEKLGLLDDSEFIPEPESEEGLVDTVLALLPTDWFTVEASPGPEQQIDHRNDQTPSSDPNNIEVVIDKFLSGLEVSQNGRSNVLSVAFTSSNPEKASLIANATANLFIESQSNYKLNAFREEMDWLANRVEQLSADVRAKDQAVQEYQAKNNLNEIAGSTETGQQLSSLTTRLIEIRAEKTEKEVRLKQVLKLYEENGAISEAIRSPTIESLRQQEIEQTRREAEFAREYGERHPLMQQIRAEKQQTKERLRQAISNGIQNLKYEVAVALSREESLLASMAKMEDKEDKD